MLGFVKMCGVSAALSFTLVTGYGHLTDAGAPIGSTKLYHQRLSDAPTAPLAAADGVTLPVSAASLKGDLLATSNEEWERLKPLMGENDPTFNDATFQALKRRYQEGIPERSVADNEADAKVLYQFLRELGGEKLVGPATELAPGTFWHDGKP